MSQALISQQPDPNLLVESLIKKTESGKIKWEATARDDIFIASIGGQATLKISWRDEIAADESSGPNLRLLDESGRTIWRIEALDLGAPEKLEHLYSLAQKIGNRVDEKVTALMEALEKL